LLAWIVLQLLLLAALGSAYIPLGPFNAWLNFLIAVITALLVLSFFMHLKYARPLTKIFAAAGFFWLLLLIGLSMSDYATRDERPFIRDFDHLYPSVGAQGQLAQPSGRFEKPMPASQANGQLEAKLSEKVNLARGKQVYKETCSMCHKTGALGAPLKGSKAAWQPRAEKGLDVLISHAVNGFKAMPPKGGNLKLDTSDIRDGIVYMLIESGIELEQSHF
jgi:cytochrome c oxidase subunit 4